MPRRYRKRTFRRRRRRGPRYTTWGSAKHLAKRALAGFRYVRKFLNTEQKYFDNTVSQANLGTVGIAECISLIPLGDGPNNREGRQVKLTSIHLKMLFNLTANTDVIRYVVVQAKTNVTPTLGSVLTTSNTLAFRNLNLVRDFNVIRDKVFSMDEDYKGEMQFSIDIPWKSKLQFNISDTGGQANPVWGAIYVFIIGRELSSETSCTLVSRIRYVDN